LFVLIFGAILGFLAKYVDGSVVGQIGSELGIWIFVATTVGAWSRSPRAAALHVFVFFVSMLCVYYLYEMNLFGFFPTRYFLAWGCLAICSPIGGYVVWFSRGKGWIAALCASIPISLLLAEGYSFIYFFSIPRGFDLFLAVLLFVFLPIRGLQHIRILPIVVVLFLVISQFHLIDRSFF
jgi:hypothetical protein